MSTENGEIKESLVVCQNNQSIEIRGSLLRLTRFAVVFEIYSPTIILRLSEVLSEFRIVHIILRTGGHPQRGERRANGRLRDYPRRRLVDGRGVHRGQER